MHENPVASAGHLQLSRNLFQRPDRRSGGSASGWRGGRLNPIILAGGLTLHRAFEVAKFDDFRRHALLLKVSRTDRGDERDRPCWHARQWRIDREKLNLG